MRLEAQLFDGIRQLGLNVDAEQQQKLLHYLALLTKWNQVYNLTAIRDPQQMVSHHLLDSLAIVEFLWAGTWLDVGSGGGLPGLVLAIVRPEWSFVLLDSNSKKTSFIQQVVIELKLVNVTVVTTRVDEWKTEQRFDGIVTRAFAETVPFVEMTKHLLVKQGGWVAMKGKKENIQFNQEDKKVETYPICVPALNAERCLVVIKNRT